MKTQYSIKDLERLSGVKAHTIRIWEKRYDLLRPNRTSTNIRYYDDNHLKRLLDVSLLQKKGHKISRISRFSHEEVKKELSEYYENTLVKEDHQEANISALIHAMVDLNETAFEKTFSSSVLKKGLETTMLELIFPFLARVGVLWNLGDILPSHEHFVTNLVKQKIYSAIDGLVTPTSKNELNVLYLIENELHEISLLFAAFLLKKRGKEVLYLGQSVPWESLETIIKQRKPTSLYTVFTTTKPTTDFDKHLSKLKPHLSKISLTLYATEELQIQLKHHKKVRFVSSFNSFLEGI